MTDSETTMYGVTDISESKERHSYDQAADILVEHRQIIYNEQHELRKEINALLVEIKKKEQSISYKDVEMNRIDQALHHIAPDKV